jgi:hypothetical protein
VRVIASEQYVAAAYIVFVALVLAYVPIISACNRTSGFRFTLPGSLVTKCPSKYGERAEV